MSDGGREQELIELIRWTLGESETDEFPSLPEDWPRRKFYWREELRRRFDAVLASPGSEKEPPNPISLSETDCLKWAESFVEHVRWKPSIATDDGTMMAWFASAIMAGYDLAQRKRDVQDREFIGWLSADIPELHHVEVPRLADSYKLFLNTRDPDTKEAKEYAARPASPGSVSDQGWRDIGTLHASQSEADLFFWIVITVENCKVYDGNGRELVGRELEEWIVSMGGSLPVQEGGKP